MTRFAVLASAASVVALLAVAPAAADYVLEEDPAFPSVVFVNFDPDTMPRVLMAPSAADLGLSVINGGQVIDQGDPAAADQTSPDLDSEDNASSDSTDEEEDDYVDDTASVSPLEERINDRVDELTRNQPDVEDILVDREIEDRLLEETDRLLQ